MKVILATRSKFNLFSWLIKKFMRTDYSHCGLYFKMLDLDLVIEATAFFGVRLLTLENFKKKNIILEEIVINSRPTGDQAVKYCFKQLGDQYSFMSILGIAFKDPKLGKDGQNSFQCSELIARAFNIKHRCLDHINVKELKDLIKGRV